VAVIGIARDGIFEPRSESNIGSAGRRACVVARAGRTSLIIFSRVDAAGADLRTIQGTNVANANVPTPQVVEMDVDLGRGVDRNVDVFVADYVLRNDSPRTGEPPPPLLMLIPTEPGVAVSNWSGRFPAMKLPMIMFPCISSAGRPKAGPTWVCRATPPNPLFVNLFWMITLSETRPRPAPSENIPAPEPPIFTPLPEEMFSATVLWLTPC